MKYIITENRLNNIIFKFLDTKLDGIEKKKGNFYDIVFAFPGKKSGILAWKKNPNFKKSGDLIVYIELEKEISNYFGLNTVDALNVIRKWVEDKYNLKVMNTYEKSTSVWDLAEDRN